MLPKIFQKFSFPRWKWLPFVASTRPSILLLVTIFLALIITYVTALNMPWLQLIRNDYFPRVSFDYLDESLKVIGGTFIGGMVALLISNTWQQKSVGLEMLKELNSPEFMTIRNALSTQMRISENQNLELESLRGWFPGGKQSKIGEKVLFDSDSMFVRKHALASMVYFVVRLSNYARSGMLNINTTRHLFNLFFVHYRVVILEFADAMEFYYLTEYAPKKVTNHPEIKNGMWLRRIDDLRYFFEFLQLSKSLLDDDPNYEYKYFKSLNNKTIAAEGLVCATDVDLDNFQGLGEAPSC